MTCTCQKRTSSPSIILAFPSGASPRTSSAAAESSSKVLRRLPISFSPRSLFSPLFLRATIRPLHSPRSPSPRSSRPLRSPRRHPRWPQQRCQVSEQAQSHLSNSGPESPSDFYIRDTTQTTCCYPYPVSIVYEILLSSVYITGRLSWRARSSQGMPSTLAISPWTRMVTSWSTNPWTTS